MQYRGGHVACELPWVTGGFVNYLGSEKPETLACLHGERAVYGVLGYGKAVFKSAFIVKHFTNA
jgi:hypothetical protein